MFCAAPPALAAELPQLPGAEISGQHPKSQLGPTFLFPERIDLTSLKWTFLPALPQGYGDKDTPSPGLPKPFPSNNSFHSSSGVQT